MKIKVCRIGDGPARVEVTDLDGAVIHTININVGEEVTIVTTATPTDIDVGDIVTIETPVN